MKTPQPNSSGSLHPACYALDITLKGDDPQELWSSLLDLVSYACECKQKQEGLWPHMVATDRGKIFVRHNDRGDARRADA